MKLQKAVIAIILAFISLAGYLILSKEEDSWHNYLLELSGLLFMLGGFMFLYPILFARKDKEGCVELDPEAPIVTDNESNTGQ